MDLFTSDTLIYSGKTYEFSNISIDLSSLNYSLKARGFKRVDNILTEFIIDAASYDTTLNKFSVSIEPNRLNTNDQFIVKLQA